MSFQFTGYEHKEAMDKVFEMAGVMNKVSLAIQAPLYALTSIQTFQDIKNVEKVFNFKGHYFNPDAYSEFNLSTGEMMMFALAMNLYNGCVLEGLDLSPHQAMMWLSKEHRDVYMSAIDYRYRNVG